LVGDIHQPLHCGCGYYEVHGHQVVLITEPDKAFGHPPTRAPISFATAKTISRSFTLIGTTR
jgi:hypothetical protein